MILCTTCLIEKPINQYRMYKMTREGNKKYTTCCRSCTARVQKKWQSEKKLYLTL
jgi:hypothetical protein